ASTIPGGSDPYRRRTSPDYAQRPCCAPLPTRHPCEVRAVLVDRHRVARISDAVVQVQIVELHLRRRERKVLEGDCVWPQRRVDWVSLTDYCVFVITVIQEFELRGRVP